MIEYCENRLDPFDRDPEYDRAPDYDFNIPDDEDEWRCAYPGKCLMPSMLHQRHECHTVEDAEAYYAEELGLKGDE